MMVQGIIGFDDAAAPPSADTVWLRMGYTFKMTPILSEGLFCGCDGSPQAGTASTYDEHITFSSVIAMALKAI